MGLAAIFGGKVCRRSPWSFSSAVVSGLEFRVYLNPKSMKKE